MADLEFSWLDALCRAAATNLPRGARGVEAAQLFLAAFPEACRRGLGDTTDSAPGLFGALVGLGILQGLPGEGAMTAAIRLIAATTELIAPRSPRRWTALYGSARDLDAPLGARLRAQVTPAMMRAPTPSPSPVRRRESIQRERDRLATELAAARRDLASIATDRDRILADLAAAANDRDRLNTELAAARNSQATAANDRYHLAADLTAARDRHDDLASQLAALATDRARLFDDLQNTRKVLARARRDLAATKESLDLTTRERSERAEELRRSESKRDDLDGVRVVGLVGPADASLRPGAAQTSGPGVRAAPPGWTSMMRGALRSSRGRFVGRRAGAGAGSMSAEPSIATIFGHTPEPDQRSYHRQQVVAAPNSGGTSRHLAPKCRTHRIPSTTPRRSTRRA